MDIGRRGCKGVFGKIGEVFYFFKDIYTKIKDYNNLKEQYKNASLKSKRLDYENQGLQTKISGLEAQIKTSETFLEQSNENIKSLNTQISKYHEGVLEIPEYKASEEARKKAEGERDVLVNRVGELDNLCKLRQETIKELRGKVKAYWAQYRNEIETLIEKEAENDNRALSYFVALDGKILASTPKFRENFHYDEIKGIKCSSLLKAPEPNGDAENWIRLNSFLQNQGEDSLEATILDGENNHKRVYLEKQKPTIIQCSEDNGNGKESKYTLVCRRIDVHDIGRWKFLSKEHREMKIKSIDESFAVLKLDEIEIENKEFRMAMEHYSRLLRERGLNLTQVLHIWDKLKTKERNYENWRRGCAELIFEQRKKEREKREKLKKQEENKKPV